MYRVSPCKIDDQNYKINNFGTLWDLISRECKKKIWTYSFWVYLLVLHTPKSNLICHPLKVCLKYVNRILTKNSSISFLFEKRNLSVRYESKSNLVDIISGTKYPSSFAVYKTVQNFRAYSKSYGNFLHFFTPILAIL